jgi:hypothetical protein
MFHHFDFVTLTKPLPGADVPVGATGTIFRVFDWLNPPVYDIHFHDENHDWGVFRVWGDAALALKLSLWQKLKGS